MKKEKENPLPVPSKYDPRPSLMRSYDPDLIDAMRVNLLAINSPCVLLQLLVLPVKVALHYHTYTPPDILKKVPGIVANVNIGEAGLTNLHQILTNFNDTPNPFAEKCKLNVSPKQRKKIEEQTRCQSCSSLWHAVRAKRITGSKCGKILCQIQKTDALLIDVLYPKPMNLKMLPSPIKWGIDNETKACEAYTAYMRMNGHADLVTSPVGFIIHPTMGWLGASPDRFVIDPFEIICNGIVEFKCPFTKKNISPEEACRDPGFYLTFHNGEYHLKRDYQYYHQVQLQLSVSMDVCQWCDFCVYTLHRVGVERIWLDIDWYIKYILELESYFDGYMLPEIVFPKLKPSYVN